MTRRGGGGTTNVPKMKGVAAQGSRPAGSAAVVPNGQYPTVNNTRKLPDVPGVIMRNPGPAINKPGKVTTNTTPA